MGKWGRLHDAVFEVTDISLSLIQCETLFNLLPEDAQNEAETYGYSDTVFGDKVYEFATENKDKIKLIISKEK